MLADAEPWSTNPGRGQMNAGRFTDVRYVAETGSTNADLLEAARGGLTGPVVLITGHQTAGRGRQDRTWFDKPGDSLLVSVLVTAERAWAPLIPLATGLAAVEAVQSALDSLSSSRRPDPPPATATALKWPNDLLVPALEERKLAGILVESTATRDSRSLAVVVGMGMNLRWSSDPPDDVRERATTLTAVARHVVGTDMPSDPRGVVLGAYLSSLDGALTTLGGPNGVEVTIERYRDRCVTVGRPVTLVTGAENIVGHASGIGDDGELLVELADGTTRAVTAGDAHHRRSG